MRGSTLGMTKRESRGQGGYDGVVCKLPQERQYGGKGNRYERD